jgi:hypothetical protein
MQSFDRIFLDCLSDKWLHIFSVNRSHTIIEILIQLGCIQDMIYGFAAFETKETHQSTGPYQYKYLADVSCEWEMSMRLTEANMLIHVRVLQISFHNYGEKGIGHLLPQYCLIREHLIRSLPPPLHGSAEALSRSTCSNEHVRCIREFIHCSDLNSSRHVSMGNYIPYDIRT